VCLSDAYRAVSTKPSADLLILANEKSDGQYSFCLSFSFFCFTTELLTCSGNNSIKLKLMIAADRTKDRRYRSRKPEIDLLSGQEKTIQVDSNHNAMTMHRHLNDLRVAAHSQFTFESLPRNCQTQNRCRFQANAKATQTKTSKVLENFIKSPQQWTTLDHRQVGQCLER
jgi:hypothetical protein